MDEYLLVFPEDKEIEDKWEMLKEKLLSFGLTKKRLKSLRVVCGRITRIIIKIGKEY